MFERAYAAVMRHYRHGVPWYHDADIRTGRPTQMQFASLQAFWPGVPPPPPGLTRRHHCQRLPAAAACYGATGLILQGI